MASGRSLIGSSLLVGVCSLAMAGAAHADVVIGNWENGATDGWIDWGTQAPIAAPKYEYVPFGATLGTSALKINVAGNNQNLAIKLQNNDLKDDFLANQQFSIDFSYPANSTPGFAEIYALAINAEGYGFVNQQPVPKFQYGFPNGGPQTTTVTWNYSALVDGNTANGEIAPTAGWVELILTTGSDASHGEFHFDNARLSRIAAPGDFNSSGALDAGDIDMLLAAAAGPVPPAEARYDVNNDGQVIPSVGAPASDSDHWVQTLAGTRYGDANLDKKVGFDDLVTLAQNYQKPDATWSMGNFNGDGVVSFPDLVALAQNYNFSAAALAEMEGISAGFAADWARAQSLVPEPASLAGMALSAGLLRRRRDR